MSFQLTYQDYLRQGSYGQGGSEAGGATPLPEDVWNAMSPQERMNNIGGGVQVNAGDPRYAALLQQTHGESGRPIYVTFGHFDPQRNVSPTGTQIIADPSRVANLGDYWAYSADNLTRDIQNDNDSGFMGGDDKFDWLKAALWIAGGAAAGGAFAGAEGIGATGGAGVGAEGAAATSASPGLTVTGGGTMGVGAGVDATGALTSSGSSIFTAGNALRAGGLAASLAGGAGTTVVTNGSPGGTGTPVTPPPTIDYSQYAGMTPMQVVARGPLPSGWSWTEWSRVTGQPITGSPPPPPGHAGATTPQSAATGTPPLGPTTYPIGTDSGGSAARVNDVSTALGIHSGATPFVDTHAHTDTLGLAARYTGDSPFYLNGTVTPGTYAAFDPTARPIADYWTQRAEQQARHARAPAVVGVHLAPGTRGIAPPPNTGPEDPYVPPPPNTGNPGVNHGDPWNMTNPPGFPNHGDPGYIGGNGFGLPPGMHGDPIDMGRPQPRVSNPLVPTQRGSGLGFADGGQIRGPGGPRDDNLLIAASDGEVVVPADVVRAKGTDFFDHLKEKVRADAVEKHGPAGKPMPQRVAAFADGGPVVMAYADGGYVDDYGNPMELSASASPGLETLPAVNPSPPPPQQMPVMDATPPMPDAATVAPVSASPVIAPATSGVGMADFKAARNNDDAEYLKGLPTMQKIGLLLQSYQAGVDGRPNPFDSLLDQKRKREVEFRNELGTTLQTIKQATELVSKMPPGKARDAMIEQIVRTAGPNGAVVKEALSAIGTDREKDVTDVISVLDNPRARAALLKAVAGSADPRKAAQDLLKDSDYMKRLEGIVDQETLPGVTAKMAVLTRAMAKMPQFKGSADDKASFSMADLRDQNAQLPKEYQLTQAELNTAARNQASLIPYGLKTDKTLQDEQSAEVKRPKEQPHSVLAKLNEDLRNKKITPEEYRKEVTKHYAADANAGAGYTTEQIDTLARQAMKDKSVLFNIGRGAQGARDLQAINKRMADIMKEEGGAGTAEQRATFTADRKSLEKLVPQLDAVEAFSNNAIQQGKVLKGLAQKVDTTGVPVIERWIRAGRSEVKGDADVSEFNAQLQLYRTEAAKIITNPNLSGQLTDAARKEVQHFLDGNASSEQIVRVVNRLEKDFTIRHDTLRDQVDVIKGRMGGKAKDAPAAKPAAAAAGDTPPAGISADSKPVGYSPQGKRVWQDPSGKKWTE